MRAMVVPVVRAVMVDRAGVVCPAVRAVVVARVVMRGRAARVVWVVRRVWCGVWVPRVPTAMAVPVVGGVWAVPVVMRAAMSVGMGLPVVVVDLVVLLVLVVRLVLVVAADFPVLRATVGMAVRAATAARGLTRRRQWPACRVRSAATAVPEVRAVQAVPRRRAG